MHRLFLLSDAVAQVGIRENRERTKRCSRSLESRCSLISDARKARTGETGWEQAAFDTTYPPLRAFASTSPPGLPGMSVIPGGTGAEADRLMPGIRVGVFSTGARRFIILSVIGRLPVRGFPEPALRPKTNPPPTPSPTLPLQCSRVPADARAEWSGCATTRDVTRAGHVSGDSGVGGDASSSRSATVAFTAAR